MVRSVWDLTKKYKTSAVECEDNDKISFLMFVEFCTGNLFPWPDCLPALIFGSFKMFARGCTEKMPGTIEEGKWKCFDDVELVKTAS